jgi:O-antigen/teichoic acid export membrane protein
MSLRNNTLWNLAGSGLPLIAAALIPFMLHRLAIITQTEAFGVLTLIWALIGYFSLFDMGVGRALACELSKLRAKPADNDRHNETSFTLKAKNAV